MLTPFEDVRKQRSVDRVRSGRGGRRAMSSAPSEVESIERRRLRIRGGRGGGLGPASTVFTIRHVETVVVGPSPLWLTYKRGGRRCGSNVLVN